MALTKLEENLNIIENLPDAPTMEPTELKQKFDEGSIKIKDYINETLTAEIDNIVTQINKDISNKILEDNKKKYYVGKLIFDTENVNPATYLGFGTWQLWGSGRVPVGVDTSQTEFNSVEKTGGEKTHKLTINEMPSHTHTFNGNATSNAGEHIHTLNEHTHTYSKSYSITGSHALTIDEIPEHSHNIATTKEPGSDGFAMNGNWNSTQGYNCNATGGGEGHTHTISTFYTNTGTPSNNSTSSSGTHAHAISGVNTNSGGNEVHNNLQPYITCYIWKRIA